MMLKRYSAILIACLIIVAVCGRAQHMTGPLDEPAWRQAETAYMTYRLFMESPPEILHTKVPYRGPYDVHLAEFPIYPTCVALLYKLTGGESLMLARIVTLLFYGGALCFLYLAWSLICTRRVAAYAAMIYMLLPLGVFYSRAVHPDYATIFFAHAFFYCALRFSARRTAANAVVATLTLCCSFVMKAPYVFYFAFPLVVYAAFVNKRRWFVTSVGLASMFIVPFLLAYAYSSHRIGVESGFTESLVYPMKWTGDLARNHFFGWPSQRLDMDMWETAIRKLYYLVFTPMGAWLGILGAVIMVLGWRRRQECVIGSLCLGLVLYALLIFPMFVGHTWYLLPMLLPAALLMALCMDALQSGLSKMGPRLPEHTAFAVLFVVLMLQAPRSLEAMHHYGHDWQRLETGRIIKEHTVGEDIVLSTTVGRSTGWSDPRILYYANRRGWAIPFEHLDEAALNLFLEHGLDAIALLVAPPHEPTTLNLGILSSNAYTAHDLHHPDGTEIGWVLLFQLENRVREPAP